MPNAWIIYYKVVILGWYKMTANVRLYLLSINLTRMLKHWKWRQTTKYPKNFHSFCSSLTFLNIARLVFVYLHSVVKHCPFPVFMYPNKHYILTSHFTMSICFHYTMYMYKLFFKSRNVNFPHPCCSRWNCWISAQSATCTCVTISVILPNFNGHLHI